MAAIELEVPKEKFARAMDYLKANATTFEDVRIGAAAVEAWGVKACPFDLKEWVEIADQFGVGKGSLPKDGGARNTGSFTAFKLRLGRQLEAKEGVVSILRAGQWDDGGYGKAMANGSDLETTYRVMRAFYLLKQAPKDVAKLRGFVGKCRNADGGYGVKPGEPSTVGGVYYATIVSKWLDELEKK
jgi:hypothetical protein